MHKSLFVFDIETVPDLEAARNLLGERSDLKQALTDYHLEITGGKNDFVRQLFHQVVAISFVECEIHNDGNGEYYVLKEVRSGGSGQSSEEEIIKGFFHYLSEKRARLVSFNGRTFDLPVLKYRAMRHNVQAGWLYRSGDKWNNYGSRYSLDWHCDLLEAFSDFGASARIRMNEACALLGLPGKLDVDGSQVDELFNAGKIEEIRNYCEMDVINTYLLYLKYQYHTGSLSKDHYHLGVSDMISYLKNEGESRPHLLEFLDAWVECSNEELVEAA
jgi:predicted PolB exonuclease-like 3'-5' exonuclease